MKVKSIALFVVPMITLMSPAVRACPTRALLTGLSANRLPASPLRSEGQVFSPQEDNNAPDSKGETTPRTIVGMWIMNFYTENPPGTTLLFDTAIEQFYADGNEISTDTEVAPTQDNTCYGVWERTARRTFQLNHIGFNFIDSKYAGLFTLTATLTVSRDGKTFTGKFESDQEDLEGNNIPEMHLSGTLKAERFVVGSHAVVPLRE
jgi:hypothetical protein